MTREDVETYAEKQKDAAARAWAKHAAPLAPQASPTRGDMAPSSAGESAGAPSRTPANATPGTGRPEERVRFSRRRQTIARRLVEAQQTAAMLTTFNEVDMSAVMDVRARRKESFK